MRTVDPGQVDRALSLDEPYHPRHGVFRWNRYHHVHVISHEMSLFDPAALLRCQLAEHLPKMRSQLVRHLGMKTTWYLQSHFVWLRLSSSSIDEVSSRVLGGSTIGSF